MHMAWGYSLMGFLFSVLAAVFARGMLSQIILLSLGAAMFWQAIQRVLKTEFSDCKPGRGTVFTVLAAAGISFPLRFAAVLADPIPARYADYSSQENDLMAQSLAGSASTLSPASVFLMIGLSAVAAVVLGIVRYQERRAASSAAL